MNTMTVCNVCDVEFVPQHIIQEQHEICITHYDERFGAHHDKMERERQKELEEIEMEPIKIKILELFEQLSPDGQEDVLDILDSLHIIGVGALSKEVEKEYAGVSVQNTAQIWAKDPDEFWKLYVLLSAEALKRPDGAFNHNMDSSIFLWKVHCINQVIITLNLFEGQLIKDIHPEHRELAISSAMYERPILILKAILRLNYAKEETK